jgi:GT2 family glycosyltransferase
MQRKHHNRKKNLSVVIVTYNGKKWIDKCIQSLINSSFPVDIIVVDNNSIDSTSDYVIQNYKNVQIIQLIKNYGFGRGNNIGIKSAIERNADYIFLLNQDAWVEENTLRVLLDLHKNNPEFGIISPLHMNGSGEKLDELFQTYLRNQFECDEILLIIFC